jgi:hypothetical protein
VNFFRKGIEKLTPVYDLKAFVVVLLRLPPPVASAGAAAVPFCAPLLSPSLRFFVAGSADCCDA